MKFFRFGMEADSQEKSEFLAKVINNAVDGMITIDENGIIEMYNLACEKVFGYEAKEVLGKNIKCLMPDPYQREHDHYLRRYREGGPAGIIGVGGRELRGLHKDGTEFPLELSVSEITLQGRRMFCGIVRDITERKSVEEQLNIYMVEAEWFRNEAEKATHLKSEFLATMSHEIRTPMNGVIGMTELLLETGLNTQQERYVRTVLSSAQSLLGIINDILDFSKIEAGKLVLEPLPIDLRQVASDLMDLFAVKADEKGLRLGLFYAEDAPRYVVGDPIRIRQVMGNLLSNAIKFTDKGRVDLIVEKQAERIRISVKDTGIGIPKDVQSSLFDKFMQADASTTRKYGGTGLGLAICKQLATMMGGEVGIFSAPGAGSTFWFTMFLSPADKNSVVSLQPVAEARPTGSLAGTKVLLVEDNIINQELAVAVLKNLGCVTTVAGNGREAIEQVESNHSYDVILMDCQMPEVDGYEATRHIRSSCEKRGLPRLTIIAMTANAMKGEREKCLEAGMDDFLTKPFLKKDLVAMLMKWVEGVSPAGTEKAPDPPSATAEEEITVDRTAFDSVRELMEDRFTEILGKYLANTDAAIEKMAKVLAEDKPAADVVLDAHSLKSSSRYMGAMKVGDAAQALEMAARAADDQKTASGSLRAELEALQEAWRRVRPFYEEEAGRSPVATTRAMI